MENMIIRAAQPSDAAALLAIYTPYVKNTAITFEYEAPSVEEFSERVRKTLEKYPYIIAEADGKIIGYAYAGAFKERAAYAWAVETTVYVKQDEKRRGVGRALYETLEKLLYAQNILNMYACIACPEEENMYLTFDSIKFHRQIGFEIIGEFQKCGYKFNQWWNMIWMEKLIGAHTDNPPTVRTFDKDKEIFK